MRKKIAIFLPNLGGGGAERVALASAADLLNRGHEVDFVLVRAEGALMPLVPADARIVDLGASRVRQSFWPLVRYLKREKPDVLHAVMWPLTVLAIIARKVSKSTARLMVSDQIAYRPESGNRKELAAIKFTTRLSYHSPDIRVVCSHGAADLLAAISAVPRDRFEVIYNPIDPPAEVKTTPEVEALWGHAGERIIAVGSLKPQKNHALLSRAFARMDRPAAKLMILGEGPLRAELWHLAKSLGISDRIIMPGFAVDPWPYYASADVFVLSSDYEGFGNVNVEAMYAGLKMVCTDCQSGPREILDGGRYGRLVPVGDANALAKAMGEALDEPGQPERMRQRALAISGPHTIARYTELLLEQ